MLNFRHTANDNCSNFFAGYDRVKAMIYITGDIHGEYKRLENKKLKKLTENDCLIVCGDFGFLWDDSEREKAVLRKISDKHFKTLFVDGTHENFHLLDRLPVVELFGGRAQQAEKNIYRLMRGEIYTIEGKTFFTFGGGESSDKELRMENGTWWKEEQPSIEEMAYGVENLDTVGRKVDYIVTHQPSMTDMALVDRRCSINPLSTYFDELSRNIVYKKWYFGSLHKNKRIPRGQCLFTDIVRIS